MLAIATLIVSVIALGLASLALWCSIGSDVHLPRDLRGER